MGHPLEARPQRLRPHVRRPHHPQPIDPSGPVTPLDPHSPARTSSDPTFLKPSAFLVDQAVEQLHAEPAACVLIGDTVTDIEAATAAGVRSIGHANKPGKASVLSEAGANVVVTTMDEVASAMGAGPAPTP